LSCQEPILQGNQRKDHNTHDQELNAEKGHQDADWAARAAE
jgi:hypothetical protein